jgi:hypothetical protein
MAVNLYQIHKRKKHSVADIRLHYVIMNCALCCIKFCLQFAAKETNDVKRKLSSLCKIKVVDFMSWHRIYQIRHWQYSLNNTVFLPRLSKYRASILIKPRPIPYSSFRIYYHTFLLRMWLNKLKINAYVWWLLQQMSGLVTRNIHHAAQSLWIKWQSFSWSHCKLCMERGRKTRANTVMWYMGTDCVVLNAGRFLGETARNYESKSIIACTSWDSIY